MLWTLTGTITLGCQCGLNSCTSSTSLAGVHFSWFHHAHMSTPGSPLNIYKSHHHASSKPRWLSSISWTNQFFKQPLCSLKQPADLISTIRKAQSRLVCLSTCLLFQSQTRRASTSRCWSCSRCCSTRCCSLMASRPHATNIHTVPQKNHRRWQVAFLTT